MHRYHIQSGSLSLTVQAETSQKAALWAIHQAMQQVLPIDPAAGQADNNDPPTKLVQVLADSLEVTPLDQTETPTRSLVVSQRTTKLRTMDVVRQWSEMFAALERLQSLLDDGSQPAVAA